MGKLWVLESEFHGYCEDCRWHKERNCRSWWSCPNFGNESEDESHACHYPHATPVTRHQGMLCVDVRRDPGLCGRTGRWFEPKSKPEKVPPGVCAEIG